MNKGNLSRRGFLQRSLAALTAAGLPVWYARQLLAEEEKPVRKAAASDRLVMGVVGIGSAQSRSLQVVNASKPSVEAGQLTFVAGCDVDASHREHATQEMRKRGFKDFEASTKDYRELLNTDSEIYGGSNVGNSGGAWAIPESHAARPFHLSLCLPPLAVLYLKPPASA